MFLEHLDYFKNSVNLELDFYQIKIWIIENKRKLDLNFSLEAKKMNTNILT